MHDDDFDDEPPPYEENDPIGDSLAESFQNQADLVAKLVRERTIRTLNEVFPKMGNELLVKLNERLDGYDKKIREMQDALKALYDLVEQWARKDK